MLKNGGMILRIGSKTDCVTVVLMTSVIEQEFEQEVFFAVLNSRCGKLMFLHLSVILFTGGCLGRHPQADAPPPGRQTPP